VRLHEMTAYVRRATGARGAVPRWQGGRMPMSSELAHAALAQLQLAEAAATTGRKCRRSSRCWKSSSAGRRCRPTPSPSSRPCTAAKGATCSCSRSPALGARPGGAAGLPRGPHDAGDVLDRRQRLRLELLCAQELDWATLLDAGHGADVGLFSTDHLLEDVLASLNASEMSQRRFREIARIAGLVFQGYPGQGKSARQLQASSSLFYAVFSKHDAGNLLLTQAQREVLEQELELGRLRATLLELQARRVRFHAIKRATPFGFALMVERFREKLSTEKLSDRVARLVRELEKAAGP
jgi:ATP-dependent Lhr-like helicase